MIIESMFSAPLFVGITLIHLDFVNDDLLVFQYVVIHVDKAVGAQVKAFVFASCTYHHDRRRISHHLIKHIVVRHPFYLPRMVPIPVLAHNLGYSDPKVLLLLV